jgi:hypothetical protein
MIIEGLTHQYTRVFSDPRALYPPDRTFIERLNADRAGVSSISSMPLYPALLFDHLNSRPAPFRGPRVGPSCGRGSALATGSAPGFRLAPIVSKAVLMVAQEDWLHESNIGKPGATGFK